MCYRLTVCFVQRLVQFRDYVQSGFRRDTDVHTTIEYYIILRLFYF